MRESRSRTVTTSARTTRPSANQYQGRGSRASKGFRNGRSILSIGPMLFGPAVSVPPNSGDVASVGGHLADDLAERERHDRDVVAAQAQRRHADQRARDRRRRHGQDEDEQEVDVDPGQLRHGSAREDGHALPVGSGVGPEAGREVRRGVRADGDERHVAEVEQAGEPDDDVQAERHDHVGGGQDHVVEQRRRPRSRRTGRARRVRSAPWTTGSPAGTMRVGGVVTGHRSGWPQACGSHRRQVRSAARRESIRRASSVAQMRSSAARSSASSASTSARRIESRAVAISLASAHPESVSVTFTVRRSAVPRARVTCPSASSWSTSRTTREWLSPRLPASRSIGTPRREGGQRRDRRRPPTGSRGGRRRGGLDVARERVDHRPQHVRRVLRRGIYARSIYMPATPVAMT